jgi:hypothetical protein
MKSDRSTVDTVSPNIRQRLQTDSIRCRFLDMAAPHLDVLSANEAVPPDRFPEPPVVLEGTCNWSFDINTSRTAGNRFLVTSIQSYVFRIIYIQKLATVIFFEPYTHIRLGFYHRQLRTATMRQPQRTTFQKALYGCWTGTMIAVSWTEIFVCGYLIRILHDFAADLGYGLNNLPEPPRSEIARIKTSVSDIHAISPIRCN